MSLVGSPKHIRKGGERKEGKGIPLERSCFPLSHGLRPKRALSYCGHPTSSSPGITSATSVANDKDDNGMILGMCKDLLAFILQLRKTSARRLLMKAVQPVIASNGVPFLQMRLVALHSMSGREKEGKK